MILLISALFLFIGVCGNEPTLELNCEEGKSIRVMSFNIRYGTANDGEDHWSKRKEFLVETITTFGPDLLGTQETLLEQRDFISTRMAGYESFGVGRDDGKDRGEMAALFYRTSRFEKIGGGHFWLSETPESVGSKGWDAALPRIATWVKLRDRKDVDSKPLFFLNTHFDHRGKLARQEAARLIRKKIQELGADCKLVVTGDFNADAGSDPYIALFADADGKLSPIVDTFRIANPKMVGGEGTFSGFKVEQVSGPRIDWIGCSRNYQVISAGIDRTARDGHTPSDHFPVTAIIE